MKERPILFSAPMVRAILDGRKTVTRRVVPDRFLWPIRNRPGLTDAERSADLSAVGDLCRYGKPGDRLWGRETWLSLAHPSEVGLTRGDIPSTWDRACDPKSRLMYRAEPIHAMQAPGIGVPWRPSIHMPRWASRITLEITGVRVERLQAISEADARAEGLSFVGDGAARYGIPGIASTWNDDPRESYRALWESINGPDSWDADPWVWVIEFKVLEGAA